MSKVRVAHMLGDSRTRVDLREQRVEQKAGHTWREPEPQEDYVAQFAIQVEFIKAAVAQYLGLPLDRDP